MLKFEAYKKAIADNRISWVFDNLIKDFKDNSQQNEVILLTSRFNNLSKDSRMGIIDHRTATLQLNQIVNSLLLLITELEANSENSDSQITNVISGKRLALIVACDEYLYAGKLRNPINDGRLMKRKLELLGFTVRINENSSLEKISHSIQNFGNELKDYDAGLFYYAGHGIQVNGMNYLIPVEANLTNEESVISKCLEVNALLNCMESVNKDVNIVILDACRNNPFERSWGRGVIGRGLAIIDAPRGSLIAYATAPGKTASDGSGNNGMYTEILCHHIEEKNLSITQLFQKVRKYVIDKSSNQQIPWESTSLTSDFYFNS